MLTLKNWDIRKTRGGHLYANGNVYGHYRLEDEDFIHTSNIERIYRLEGNRYIFETRSGSLYQLEEAEMDSKRSEKTKELMSEMEIIDNDTSIIARVNKSGEEFFEKKQARESTLENAINWSEQNMNNIELYLVMDKMYVLKAVAKCENSVYEIIPSDHIGMFQDSVLVTDWEYGNVDFRYFPNALMEPYHWSDGLNNIYINNIGSIDIVFKGTDEEIVCEIGKITKIGKHVYRGEGLFSPDIVSGKCALKHLVNIQNNDEK